MPALKSVTAGGTDWPKDVAATVFPEFVEKYPFKYAWFLSKEYSPHEWQAGFHSASNDDKLCRYRHLVAGRRGGKTLSAAWEVLFYCLFPEQFHIDYPGPNRKSRLWVWALAKDHEVGRPSRSAMMEACLQAGLVKDKDFTYNKSEKIFEFNNGSIVHFRSAEDPQSLRGAGLDILWIDEAAMIPSSEAYEVARPALSDKIGQVITTTTPKGKNWLWEEFWGKPKTVAMPDQFRVEYTSIDNSYFPQEEWEWAKEHYHPVMFKQEYMAAFDAMSGVELQGSWLHFYTVGTPDDPDDITLPVDETGRVRLRKFIGVDPAISLADTADFFAMTCIGVSEDNTQAFVLDTFKDRLAFPDQIDKIKEWFLKYRPEYIGIEANNFQRALVQQGQRMEGLPPIVPIMTKGKKWERILSMAPVFKLGKVRIHRTHKDLIDQWVSYDSKLSNPKDDVLDATELALSAAGVLLPMYTPVNDPEPQTLDEEAWLQVVSRREGRNSRYDDELGAMA